MVRTDRHSMLRCRHNSVGSTVVRIEILSPHFSRRFPSALFPVGNAWLPQTPPGTADPVARNALKLPPGEHARSSFSSSLIFSYDLSCLWKLQCYYRYCSTQCSSRVGKRQGSDNMLNRYESIYRYNCSRYLFSFEKTMNIGSHAVTKIS